jgi:hypothetical protein
VFHILILQGLRDTTFFNENVLAAAEDDDDEPIVSGFGHVSKECDEEILGNWSDILVKWRKNYADRPRGLQALVRKGIPEALRGEVWQLLAGSAGDETEMIDTYRSLLKKVCLEFFV